MSEKLAFMLKKLAMMSGVRSLEKLGALRSQEELHTFESGVALLKAQLTLKKKDLESRNQELEKITKKTKELEHQLQNKKEAFEKLKEELALFKLEKFKFFTIGDLKKKQEKLEKSTRFKLSFTGDQREKLHTDLIDKMTNRFNKKIRDAEKKYNDIENEYIKTKELSVVIKEASDKTKTAQEIRCMERIAETAKIKLKQEKERQKRNPNLFV